MVEEEVPEDEMAEFAGLSRELDQLDRVLDALESKSDHIQHQVRELLEDSRQARLELQEENADSKE